MNESTLSMNYVAVSYANASINSTYNNLEEKKGHRKVILYPNILVTEVKHVIPSQNKPLLRYVMP